ncbi:MAG: tRNA-dihydrouridine synthase [Helicobacteraceae bacterium]|nr:tRNA-dihydrouridine synthase [Helicobacteraceae bacterium]
MFDFSAQRYILAPLAGWTDLPFRECVKKFGADLTISEMISANALVCNPARSRKYYEKSPLETPFAVQIAANNAEIAAKAAELLSEANAKGELDAEILDLNAGCPAPKVTRNGGGSALLKDLKTLETIVKAMKKASKFKLLSVKTRLGWDRSVAEEIAKVCEGAGADFITIHARTRSGGFTAPVDYAAIFRAKGAVKIPVIANGDIDSAEKARAVLAETGADGVMIARAAMGAPWIFAELKGGDLNERASAELKARVILAHFDAIVKFHGDRGVFLFRKHAHRYAKSLDGAARFREEINRINDPAAARSAIARFFGN